MSYPFIQWPTFEHLCERLIKESDCTYHPNETTVQGVEIGELRRVINGNVFRYATPYSNDHRLAPAVIRSICAQLRVDPTLFGLTLG